MEIDDYIVATDEGLIAYALEGDVVAFEHLFNRYRNAMYQLYVQRTGGNTDDASDLLQETFVKVYLNLHRYNPAFTFSQWVYTIARNTFIDYTRRRPDFLVSIDKAVEWSNAIPASSTPTPEERMIEDQNRIRLEGFMNRMSPAYRQLIELRFFREFSYEEIAAELKLPLGTVKTRIHRAREQLCRFIVESSDRIIE